VNSLLAGGEVPGLWSNDELTKEVAPLESARDADANWRGPPGAAGLYAYFLHRIKVGLPGDLATPV
jgi:dynein heavy chain 2